MTLAGHDGEVNKLVFHSNGKYLFSGSDDKSVRVWDLSNNGVCVKKMMNLHEMFVTSLAVSRKFLASGDTKSVIKVWALR